MSNDMERGTPLPGHGLLNGRTVLVTGAAGTGIGISTARRCVQEGARVAISGRNESRLEAAAEDMEADLGQRPLTVRCDVTEESEVRALLSAVDDEFDGLDILVNNAGVGGVSPVAQMSDEQWDEVFDSSLKGTFRCTRAALGHMLPRGSGTIVNVSSVVGWKASPGMAHYAAAKAGVMAFTRSVALEVASAGIRVNAVAPTLAAHEDMESKLPTGMMQQLGAQQALGRAAEPEEIATVIVFLASEYSSYMTGEVLSVSGQHA